MKHVLHIDARDTFLVLNLGSRLNESWNLIRALSRFWRRVITMMCGIT